MQTCNNCHQSFEGKYCRHCGQKASVGRLDLHTLWHELTHAITHVDKGLIKLTKDLLVAPKKVYTGYFSGKRKTYFSPVMFFLIMAGLVVILGEKLWDFEDYITGRNDEFGRILHRYEKIRFVIFIPLISLLTWLLFYKKYNLAESITFWFFCMGTISFFGILSYLPEVIFIKHRDTIRYFADWLIMIVMFIHIFKVFFERTWWSGIKCFLLGFISYISLAYIFLLLAYYKGLDIDFNLWHLLKDIFAID
jgi:Protein of unknown function (DUF3667)